MVDVIIYLCWDLKLNHVSKRVSVSSATMVLTMQYKHGWPSTQPHKITHNQAAHHRAAHNPSARWGAGSVVCVTRMANSLRNPTSQIVM